MQFNDDTDLPDPGDHVILDDEDLGSATYDSDHDGVAYSVIVGQEDYSVVITDSDHDGEADSVKAYDHEGNQVDPRTGASVGDGTADGTTDGTTDGGITVIGDDGTPVTVGQPTADLNGDGTPDTAVVQNHDGSTTGYTDVDGDGHADQITQINADGSVVIATSDGDGHWQVQSTGHLDSDGKFVEDPKNGDVEADAPVTAAQAA